MLATADVGRIGVSTRALPLIFPVCFAVDGDQIVISTQHRGSASRTVTTHSPASLANAITSPSTSTASCTRSVSEVGCSPSRTSPPSVNRS